MAIIYTSSFWCLFHGIFLYGDIIYVLYYFPLGVFFGDNHIYIFLLVSSSRTISYISSSRCLFLEQSCTCLLFGIFFSVSFCTMISYMSYNIFLLLFSSTAITYISISHCLFQRQSHIYLPLGVFLYGNLIHVFL